MMAARPQLPLVAAGPYRFRCDHAWAKLPPGYAWGITHAVALDRSGRVFIAHTGAPGSASADTVFIFSADGAFLGSWGSAFQGGAHGLEIVDEGGREFAYLTDLERGLFKLTLDGEIVWRFEKPELYRKAFGLNWRPSNAAVAAETDVYLSDGYGTGFIVRIDRRSGEERGVFGGPGPGPQQLFHPHGLAIDRRRGAPELVVAENIRNGLRYFDLDGKPLRTELAGDPAWIAPRHFAFCGELLVIPDLGGRLVFLDARNRTIGLLGKPERPFEAQVTLHEADPSQCPAGAFWLPHDVAFDAEGNLFVVEWIQGGRVTKLFADPQ